LIRRKREEGVRQAITSEGTDVITECQLPIEQGPLIESGIGNAKAIGNVYTFHEPVST
jgi:hypothetical protein